MLNNASIIGLATSWALQSSSAAHRQDHDSLSGEFTSTASTYEAPEGARPALSSKGILQPGFHDRAMRDFDNGSSRSDSATMGRGDGTFLICPFKNVIVKIAEQTGLDDFEIGRDVKIARNVETMMTHVHDLL